ncbi:MAG: hypothetical protein JW951_06510 [Lentisphaerae bacterium]|nr:hypothetical protein [Lentisphaerota bacterium]
MIERIFILHHTHVDLGYTGDRVSTCRDLVDMVDRAVDHVEATRHAPAPERFRWIHEVSWPVLGYLKRPDARAALLFDQMRRGDSELTAFYVHPTDLFDRRLFEATIDRAVRLAAEQDLPLRTAMFSDCPGIAWSAADMLAERGVRYLSAAPDFIMSYPLELERPFWWEGPNGGRVLTWFADWRNMWYAEGLARFALHEDPARATDKVQAYVAQLHEEGYRWKGLALHAAMDNQPPRPEILDFVRTFNAAQDGVRVQMATNMQFFEYMEARHGGEFAVHRGAWPDWWANGNASAAYETACSRRAKRLLRRVEAAARARGTAPDPARLEAVIENLAMFDEHTWGHDHAVRAPWSLPARLGWADKRVYALRALDGARRLDAEVCPPVPDPAPETAPPPAAFEGLESPYFRAAYDANTGRLTELVDKASGASLLDAGAPWGWGELIHERIRGGSREQIYDITRGAANPEAKRPRPAFMRKGDHAGAGAPRLVSTAAHTALAARGRLPGARFTREIRLLHDAPRIDVTVTLDKGVVTTYESLYLAFPFMAEPAEVWVENADAVYRAGIDQLPGSATDWHSVGRYVAVSGSDGTVILAPHDVPLVQIGDIHTGKWQKRLRIEHGHIYSWIMNNMWWTNFPAYQEGALTLTWSVFYQPGPFQPTAGLLDRMETITNTATEGGLDHAPV